MREGDGETFSTIRIIMVGDFVVVQVDCQQVVVLHLEREDFSNGVVYHVYFKPF